MGENQKKLREQVDKMKEEKAEMEAQNEENEKSLKQEIRTQLATVQANENLAKLYDENSALGAENLSQAFPLLKIHTVGKSSGNQLADGTRPNDGWFFYKPTSEQFEEVACHILTVSRGFRAEGLNAGEEKFNQIIAGVFADDHRPFYMFFTGKRLSKLWEFGKEASQYTKAKPIKIPMFALTIKMKTRSEANKFGESWMVDFSILRETNGSPVLVTDEGKFIFLRDQVEIAATVVEQLIASKVREDTAEEAVAVPTTNAVEGDIVDNEPNGHSDVDPDQIPF